MDAPAALADASPLADQGVAAKKIRLHREAVEPRHALFPVAAFKAGVGGHRFKPPSNSGLALASAMTREMVGALTL